MNNLARTLAALRDLASACDLHRQVIDTMQQVFAPTIRTPQGYGESGLSPARPR